MMYTRGDYDVIVMLEGPVDMDIFKLANENWCYCPKKLILVQLQEKVQL